MQMNKERIKSLIRSDIILVNGGSGNMKKTMAICIAAVTLMGLFISPMMGMYAPLIAGGFLPVMLFQSEQKNQCEKMCAVLPISRHELVTARFLMMTAALVAFGTAFYFLMLLSMKIKLYHLIPDWIEVLDMMAKLMNFTPVGLFNILYFFCMALSLTMMASSLRSGFKNGGASVSMEMTSIMWRSKEERNKVLGGFAFIIVLIGFVYLVISGVLPFGHALSVIRGIVMQLMQAADGVLCAAVSFAIGVMALIYFFVCAILEYDDKEL